MGPWDVMSSHLIKRDGPPPGLSSFTKIRLGWITKDQAVIVKPGEEQRVILAPLAKGGSLLVVKIPLNGGLYYLLENRQSIGYDSLMPDTGLLILKVDPEAMEGSGTVRIMDADPGAARFAHATFQPGKARRDLFVDKENKLAVVPLRMKREEMEVLITSPERAATAAPKE
ncbi:MAG: hypothetical protein A2V65_02090 [Deltaproteobacteria bacterium RBG_13_49_15]|nr:MAG: hypothetical protein A2V65_02090 [Deltaproteobacteria bacterium RBG_13_49_15]